MAQPEYRGAIAYAINYLREELPPIMYYHNLWHTEEGVMPAAVRLGQLSGCNEDEIALLELGAAFHDLGMAQRQIGHEIIAARIAAQALPEFGIPSEQIETIMGMILATRLPQTPRTFLEQIVADADLDVLGREDFFSRGEMLRQEQIALGMELPWLEWQASQLSFLKQHTYFTPAAKSLRDASKQEHIAILEETIRQGVPVAASQVYEE